MARKKKGTKKTAVPGSMANSIPAPNPQVGANATSPTKTATEQSNSRPHATSTQMNGVFAAIHRVEKKVDSQELILHSVLDSLRALTTKQAALSQATQLALAAPTTAEVKDLKAGLGQLSVLVMDFANFKAALQTMSSDVAGRLDDLKRMVEELATTPDNSDTESVPSNRAAAGAGGTPGHSDDL
ncbi:hypothetical protein IE81DRAFT_364717 [Ceraceosorus guamensis]|uniref:Uncharacterized protein n=1 Tax=Ceraceosorus guamensis TaxID=1522189 RepID=A0A316WAQ8_9BASI|nr:hypothetical protein IE81DRAFT_364717 [Ceraceosorus guamensis]PWN44725.1 hypothetical protein IE81DRAFT_364717 [Ceraceosorus guamensis]